MYQVEHLRNGELKTIHISRLKFYSDIDLDTEAFMSHVLASETGMPVQRLTKFVLDDGELKANVRWRGLPATEDSL